MSDPDPQKARRVTEAMMQMIKIDIAKLKQAYAGLALSRPSDTGGQIHA